MKFCGDMNKLGLVTGAVIASYLRKLLRYLC